MLDWLKPMTAHLLGALAFVLAVLAGTARSNAAPGDHDFTGQVPGVAGKTWIDLLSQIFPSIAVAPSGYATAGEVIDLPSIGAGDDSWIQCGDVIKLLDRDARPIRLGGRDYTIATVMIEDDCVGPIALFDDKGKLVDAVNIRGDQHVSFSGEYVRPLGPDGALVTASLRHDNSSQSYDISSLILARPGGLSSIGYVLAFGSRDCRDRFTEETKIGLTASVPMARINVAITRRTVKYADDCETRLGREVKTTFKGYWRWDAKKNVYEAHTKELNSLADWNEKHF